MKALITGASSGLGREMARLLAARGYELILCARREERLRELAAELPVPCRIIAADVSDEQECRLLYEAVQSEDLEVVINNAGFGLFGEFVTADLDEELRMIDTNVKGLLYITHEVAPLMIKNEKGHIVNIASVAGKEVYPGGNVYCATKHAVDALSKAMRIDMLKHNIKVTNIAPGMVETEFSVVRYKGDQQAADNVYKGVTPLTGEDIADTIVFAVTRPAHICLNDIQIMPTAQASSRDVNRK